MIHSETAGDTHMHMIRTLVMRAFAATALSACMPDTPDTQLTWDAKTRMTKSQERLYSAPAPHSYASAEPQPAPRYASSAPRTYVYQDSYANKAPAPLGNPAYAAPAYGQSGNTA